MGLSVVSAAGLEPGDGLTGVVPLPVPRRALAAAWLGLAVLILAAVLGWVDRMVFNLLAEPVRQAMALSDTQLGLLQGAGFALFAGVATLPLGWLGDRFDRRLVLAACVLLWSAATAMRGTAHSYAMLFVASIGLGVGEAGLAPIVYSMIPELFPRRQRALANTLFAFVSIAGGALGTMLGGAVLGLVEQARPLLPPALQAMENWRLGFFAMALPGPLVALLVLLIGGRTGRAAGDAQGDLAPAGQDASGLMSYRLYMRSHWRTLAGLVTGIGVANVGLLAVYTWVPILAARQFGATPAQLGQGMGLALLAGTVAGAALGAVALRFAQRRIGAAAPVRVVLLANLTAALLSLPLVLVRSANDVFVLLALIVVPLIAGTVVIPNVLQDVSAPHLRSRIIATLTVAAMPFAVLGPLLVGGLSDALKSVPNGLAWALVLITLACGCAGAVVLRRSENAFVRLVQAMQSHSTEP